MTELTDDPSLCACFHLRRATRSLTRFYDESLRDLGITTPQFTILALLHQEGPTQLSTLADHLVMDSTTLTRNLDRLEERELVVSETGEEDARVRVVNMTPEGTRTLEEALPAWKQAQEAIVDGLGEDQFEELLEVLDRIPGLLPGTA